MNNSVDVCVLATSRAIIITVVDDLVMAIHGRNQATPVGLLKTRKRPEVIELIVLVVQVV
jgi:hypothetical protein